MQAMNRGRDVCGGGGVWGVYPHRLCVKIVKGSMFVGSRASFSCVFQTSYIAAWKWKELIDGWVIDGEMDGKVGEAIDGKRVAYGEVVKETRSDQRWTWPTWMEGKSGSRNFLGAKPNSPIESWGRSPRESRAKPESKARNAWELRGKPDLMAKPEKKKGEGEWAWWTPPQKFF